MPSNMIYACFGAEFIRIARVSLSFENFCSACRVVIERAFRQGAKTERLEKMLKRIYGRQQVFHSLAENVIVFVENLLKNT